MIAGLAQTPDGFLWLGAIDGLYRFDGVSFEHFERGVERARVNSQVHALFVSRDGTLWVGYSSGAVIAIGSGDRVTSWQDLRVGYVQQFAESADGRLWMATDEGLFTFDGGKWHLLGTEQMLPPGECSSVYVDHEQTVWVSMGHAVYARTASQQAFTKRVAPVAEVSRFAEAPDHTLWIAEGERWVHPLLGRHESMRGAAVNVGASSLLFDRAGSLWIACLTEGMRFLRKSQLYQHSPSAAEKLAVPGALTAAYAASIFQDREGTIWIGTVTGLDSFRRSAVGSIRIAPSSSPARLIPGDNHDLWLTNLEHVEHIQHGKVTDEGALPPASPLIMPENAWVPGERFLFRRRGSRIKSVSYPKNFAVPLTTVPRLLQASPVSLWISTKGQGTFSLKNGAWQSLSLPSQVKALDVHASFTEPSGTVWIGYADGTLLALSAKGKVEWFAAGRTLGIGSIWGLAGDGERLWISSDRGLFVLQDGKLAAVLPAGREDFGNLASVIEAQDKTLWLTADHSVFKVPAAEWMRTQQQPDYRVRYQIFTALDGLASEFMRLTALGSDGTVWFLSWNGISWIAPDASTPKNTLPPPVVIETVEANGHPYLAQNGAVLPAGVETLHFRYTALSLAVPNRVKFLFKLEGWDRNWVDAGAQREAFYTRLRPGRYIFHVKACNNDGIWNDTGSSLAFTIAPRWYQTKLFYAAVAALAILAVWLLYRYRVWKVAEALKTRYDDRLAERSRIGRELHDTLLQTIQATGLLLGRALESTNQGDLQRLVKDSSLYLEEAVTESRRAIYDLKKSGLMDRSFLETLQMLGEGRTATRPLRFSTVVTGQVRALKAEVEREVEQITAEAVRNAEIHSSGENVTVFVTFGADFELQIVDDGVGLPFEPRQGEKQGHYGLQIMRERADVLGGSLLIESRRGEGTTITLSIPRVRAYAENRSSLRDSIPFPIRRLLSRNG